jgi:hypothetical protein
MGDLKQPHYVPRFYLSRFADPRGRVWAFDKSTARVFSAAPEKLAKDGMLRPYDPSGLATLEKEAANITSCWFRQIDEGTDTVEIPAGNREAMSWYIASQALRTTEQRTICGQLSCVEEHLSGLPASIRGNALNGIHAGILAGSLLDELAKAICASTWVFGKNGSGLPFYTSDNPVTSQTLLPVRRHQHPVRFGRVGSELALPISTKPKVASELALPLSPTLIFYAYELVPPQIISVLNNHVSPVVLTPALVTAENCHQVGHSGRFVFCDRNNFDDARDFCTTQPIIGDPTRNRFEDGH